MVLRAALLISLTLLLLGSAVSAAPREVSCLACHPVHYRPQGTCVFCHQGDPRSTRPEVAHQRLIPGRYAHFALPGSPVVERGRQHLEKAGCRRCHLLGGRGNRLAGNLDRFTRELAPAEIAAAIRRPALLMPDFRFPERQRVELINGLLASGPERAAVPEETGRVVYFASEKAKEDVFSRHCGACHRLLSPVLGGLGSGKIGPNLSGLLTAYYPRFSRGQERWSMETVRKWLQNPRRLRPEARMPPVRLEEQELTGLLEILQAAAVQEPAAAE